MRGVASDVFADFPQGDIRYKWTEYGPSPSPDRPGTATPRTSERLNATARPVSTKYVNGTHVVQSDKQVSIPNDGKATPEMTGMLQIDGVQHKIIEIMPRPAAGEPITWTVIVRR